MTSQRIAQTNQQQKSEKPQESGILQRAAVRSVSDAGGQLDEQEALALSNSAFSKDFSQVPISTTKPQQFQARNPQSYLVPPIQAKLSIGEPGDRVIQGKGEMIGNSQVSSEVPRPNKTGLPDRLKTGIENLSGYSMNNVRVHYNSEKPAQLQAHAYAQGTDIYLGSGQEKHLPHEAWHIVQQKQDRVKPTLQGKGVSINNDKDLEREADMMGGKAERMNALQSESSTLVTTTTPHENSPQQTIIQQAQIATVAYLNSILASSASDPEWDQQWTMALNAVVSQADFTQYVCRSIDDDNENDIQRIISNMKTLAGLYDGKPNIYKIAMDAVRWYEGIESSARPSGFGSLDVSPPNFEGRPGFPVITQENVSVKSGEHRRHILPWHSIRNFVELAYNKRKRDLMPIIINKLEYPDGASQHAVIEAVNHMDKERSPGAGPYNDSENLKMALFVMNGNPRNLWPGKGKVNSAINTAAMHMNNALNGVQSFENLNALVEKWHKASGKEVYTSATTLGAEVLHYARQKAWEDYHLVNDTTREAEFVQQAVQKVRDNVISNLEIDLLGASSVQTKIALSKHSALEEPIMVIDGIVTGNVDITQVATELIQRAVSEFMTYAK